MYITHVIARDAYTRVYSSFSFSLSYDYGLYIYIYSDLEFAATGEIVDAFFVLLVADVVPRDCEDRVYTDVHGHVVRVAVLVTVHRSDYTFACAD